MSTCKDCPHVLHSTPDGDNGLLDPTDDTALPWPYRPCETDPDTPSVARIYDVYQGGSASNRADRAFAARAMQIIPDARLLAAANRQFLVRAVRQAISQGVVQFIDIGAGLPSAWALHHAAQAADPISQMLYLDNEAVAVEAMRNQYASEPGVSVARCDVRDVDGVLAAAEASRRIDLSSPVGIIMGLLLHFIPDREDPVGLLAQYRAVVASGSHVIISHDTADGRETDMQSLAALYASTNRPLVLRDRRALLAMLDGFDVLAPGVVHLPLWRPDADDPVVDPPDQACIYAAVGRT